MRKPYTLLYMTSHIGISYHKNIEVGSPISNNCYEKNPE